MLKALFNWLLSLFKPNNYFGASSAEFVTEAARDPSWHTLSSNFLKGKKCAICGSPDNLEAHHKKAFHTNPELELDLNNLIPLCRNPARNCHFVFGHLMNWKTINHDIDNTVQYFQLLIKKAKIEASRHENKNTG
jgi:5-methylcytosine-specific restriction protein A